MVSPHSLPCRPRRGRGQAGFTLVELLVVIVVLGLLSSVVVFAVGTISDTAKTNACATDRQTIKTAEEAYKAHGGAYGDEAALVSAGNLTEASTLHDVTVSMGSYVITDTGDCGSVVLSDGFEPPGVQAASSGAFFTVNNGSTFGPWTVVAGSIDVVSTGYWHSSGGGTQDVDLNGSAYGSITRTITGLTAGHGYTLDVAYAYNPECGAGNATMRIRIADLDTSVTATNSIKTAPLVSGHYVFTPSGTSTTLRFDGTGGNQYCGVVLDDISID